MIVDRLTSAARDTGRTPRPKGKPAAKTALRAAACAAALAALAACSSPPSRFYTLGAGSAPAAVSGAVAAAAPAGAAGAAGSANPAALLIEVPPVDVPSQVARNQMVVQAGASRVDVLEQERWSSLPGDEIRRALSGDLAQRLDTIDVFGSPYPAGVPVYRISVNVQRFESWPGSQAVLEAVWSVRAVGSRAVLTCRTLAAEPVGPDFDALVEGHRRAVDRMSAQIAAGVRALAASGPVRGAASETAATLPAPVPCPSASPAPAASNTTSAAG
ncbi:membrane integrity-associated transporter subunit PqiC [Trinickia terrae]|uniref:Membrane integrity-associated transporter subunit PqiC n=1 Tax=Trinickia terrae TaxID=2571161 RepID=A0A4U1IBU8_9BURK|nr:PqiC family protein [Trinickia terrae]TKC91048.1 membrane integrity-associated transporter subunit PqiC [Trinickia terrae]